MDQVLFSEPSTKMKEKMAEIRALELKTVEAEKVVAKKKKIKPFEKDDSSSEEDEFLRDKFGS